MCVSGGWGGEGGDGGGGDTLDAAVPGNYQHSDNFNRSLRIVNYLTYTKAYFLQCHHATVSAVDALRRTVITVL